MRRHTKDSSAFTHGGGWAGPVPVAAAGFLCLFLLLAMAPDAGANKVVDRFFPTEPSTEGEAGTFAQPAGLAVNDPDETADGTSHGGWVYVADQGNSRIQAFDENEEFQWAIGKDVVKPGGTGNVPQNEVQTITIDATGGDFALRYISSSNQTGPIAWNADAATIQAALEAVPAIEPGDVGVSGPAGGPWTVEFVGSLADQNVSNLSLRNNNLTGGSASGSVVEAPRGGGTEKCTVAADCKVGVAGTLGGEFSNGSGGLALDQETGDLFVREAGSRRVQQLDADGNFIRAWGADVVQPGGSGDKVSVVNEVQAVELTVAFGSITGGTFTLAFDEETTAPIVFNANAAAVESALEALAGIEDVVAAGSSPSWTVEFVGAQEGTDVPQMVGDGSELSGGFGIQVAVTTPTPGGAGIHFEVCVNASECKAGSSAADTSAGALGEGDERDTDLEIVPPGLPNSGNVVVADPGNSRLLEFDPDAATDEEVFVRGLGWDVVPSDEPGDIDGDSFEVCVEACKSASTPGIGISQPTGRFFRNTPHHVAIDADGVVYADNRVWSGFQQRPRLDRLVSTGTTPAEVTELSPFAEYEENLGFGDEPHGIEVDKESDLLYWQNSDPESTDRVHEYDLSQEPPVETADSQESPYLLNSGLVAVSMASNESNGDLYVVPVNTNRVYVLDENGADTPPEVTIDPPANVTESSATFSGTVNPGGFPSEYRFEYSKSGAEGAWTPVGPLEDIGSGTTDIQVPQPGDEALGQATGLEANATYRVRIVVKRGFGNGESPSAEVFFVTDSVAPAVTTASAQSVGDDFAYVSGVVNANSKPTTYRVEYGNSLDLEEGTPPTGAGSGGKPRNVLQRLEGLDPNTKYFFRVVAENEDGRTVGQVSSFVTRPPARGFSDRAFEQVSPVEKGPDSVNKAFTPDLSRTPDDVRDANIGGYAALPTAGDGSAHLFLSDGAFADMEFGGGQGPLAYVAERNRAGDGWTTRTFQVPFRHPDTVGIRSRLFGGVGGPGLSIGVLSSQHELRSAPQLEWPDGGWYLHRIGHSVTPIIEAGNPIDATLSADASHFYFVDDEDRSGDPGIVVDGSKKYLYDYDLTTGSIDVVSVEPQPSGSPFVVNQVSIGGQGIDDEEGTDTNGNAVSDDGEYVFFTPAAGFSSVSDDQKVYRHNDGETLMVSPSERTDCAGDPSCGGDEVPDPQPDPQGEKAKVWVDATPAQGPDDPARVFFLSSEQLTDDANTGPTRAGNDLYRYDVNEEELVDISAETNTVDGARVQGLVGISRDGKRVYYVAKGRPVAGQGVEGGFNLYRWHDDGSVDGDTRYVTTFDSDLCDRGVAGHYGEGCSWLVPGHTARVSDDGRTLLFQSGSELTGYLDNGQAQLYLYEDDGQSGEGRLSCISCLGASPLPQGSSAAPLPWGPDAESEQPRILSADGERAFFNSEVPLLPEDTNGEIDVYEWQAGDIRLIAPGLETGSLFRGASRSGDDVFIDTGDRLVGQDVDGLRDIYDARVDGGIPEQFPSPPGLPCVGEECKPQAEDPPASTEPPSTELQSDGNYVVPFRVGRMTAKQRRSFSRRALLVLRVAVGQPGRIVARAVKGKRVLGAGSKPMFRAGATRVRLRLRRGARRLLRKRGHLRFRVEVRFAGETQVSRFALRDVPRKRSNSRRNNRRAK